MTAIGSAFRWTAFTLLIALAGCAGDVAQPTGLPDATPSAGQPIPNENGVATGGPTLEITTALGWGELHAPPGFALPTGPGYQVIVHGENFPPDWNGHLYMYGTFLDGYPLPKSGGSGLVRGTYDLRGAADCPSRLREVWAVVESYGKTFESKHIAPAC